MQTNTVCLIILLIIIWFGNTVTVSHFTKCNTNSKSASHVSLTYYPHPSLQGTLPCQFNILSTPLPAGSFLPDTAPSTRSKAQTWSQFNHHAFMKKLKYYLRIIIDSEILEFYLPRSFTKFDELFCCTSGALLTV